jgi:hypothetical protein
MAHRLAIRLVSQAAAVALVLATGAPLAWAQTGTTPTQPAEKTPAKPGAQAGPNPAGASAASSPKTSPPAEKKPAKPGAQAGPNASGATR